MSSEYNKTVDLLKQLINSKKNLANTLTNKGEEASFNEPFDTLVDKAANYTPKTYIFVDEDGKEAVGTLVDTETSFDATENDIREGKLAATDRGVTLGTKVIPSYNTTEGIQIIPSGQSVQISTLKKLDCYSYTKIQAILCEFNTSLADSTSAIKISINDNVYEVKSATPIAAVEKNDNNKTIEFGITNDTTNIMLLRYFTYKEIY